MRRIFALAALTAVSMTVSAGQTHFVDPDRCAGGVLAVPDGSGAVLYVSDPDPVNGGENGTWIYLESNNHAGLQRGGYNETLVLLVGEDVTDTVGEKDPCDTTQAGDAAGHGVNLKPDTIIF